jgi:hypothetical protein
MNDPNIAAGDPNGCLWIDDPKPSPYWLSPNVIMTTKPMDPSDVYPGGNTSQVTVTWQGGDNCAGAGFQAVLFDLYIGDPFMTMIPGSTLDTLTSLQQVKIGSGDTVPSTVPTAGTWDSSGLPHLSQPHHACMIARVYPFGVTPDGGDLSGYPSGDLHYAQHNCTVNTSDGQGLLKIQIGNGTLLREPELVAIQAVPDLNPNATVLAAVLPSLKLIPSFKQIATTPLRSVGLNLGAFKSTHESLLERIEEWIEHLILELIRDLEGKAAKAGGAHARIMLPPGLFAKFDFTADLSGAKVGDAHIYHLSQVNSKGEPWGGVTVAIAIT